MSFLSGSRTRRKASIFLLLLIASSVPYIDYVLEYIRSGIIKFFSTISDSDTIYYISKIANVIIRNESFGNFFNAQKSSQIFGAGDSLYLTLFGYAGKILQLNVIQTYLIVLVISGFLTLLMIHLSLSQFTIQIRVLIAFLLYILIYVPESYRIGPTQYSIWIVLFILLRFESKLLINSLQYIFCIILSFSNPLYCIFVIAFLSLQNFRNRDFIKKYDLNTLTKLAISLASFLISYLLPKNAEQMARFGLENTRSIGAKATVLSLFFLLLIAIFLWRIGFFNEILYFSLVIFLLITVLNSQIVTGRAFEMESHYSSLIQIYSIVIFLNLIKLEKIEIKTNGIVLGSCCLLIFIALVNNKVEYRLSNEKFILLQSQLTEMNKQNMPNTEFKVKFNTFEEVESISMTEVASILTNRYLSWSTNLRLSDMGNKELLRRFTCSFNQELVTTPRFFEMLDVGVFYHTFQNTRLRLNSGFDFLLTAKEKNVYVRENLIKQEYWKTAKDNYDFWC